MDDKALGVRGQVVGSHMPHALSPPIDLLSPPPAVQDRLTDRPPLLHAHLCFKQSPVVHSLAFYSFSLTLCTHSVRRHRLGYARVKLSEFEKASSTPTFAILVFSS